MDVSSAFSAFSQYGFSMDINDFHISSNLKTPKEEEKEIFGRLGSHRQRAMFSGTMDFLIVK